MLSILDRYFLRELGQTMLATAIVLLAEGSVQLRPPIDRSVTSDDLALQQTQLLNNR